MKLTEEMDVDLTGVPSTGGDTLPRNGPLKTGRTSSSAEPFSLNGKSGMKSPTMESAANGHTSPDSHETNMDEVGFEVESYDDFNAPHGNEENESEKMGRKSSSEACEDHSNSDDNSDAERLSNGNCSADPDVALNSSNFSEEFQLRLSDDEEGHGDASSNKNISSDNDTVTSTTGSSKSRFSHGLLIEGSGLTEGICSLVESQEKKTQESGSDKSINKDADTNASADVQDQNVSCDQHSSLSIHALSESSCTEQVKTKDQESLGSEEILQSREKATEELEDKKAEVTIPQDKDHDTTEDKQKKISDERVTSSGSLPVTSDTKLNQDEESILLEDNEIKSTNDGPELSGQDELKSSKPETTSKISPDLSFEDKIEAELEAELAAEIAAQKEKDEKIIFTAGTSIDKSDITGESSGKMFLKNECIDKCTELKIKQEFEYIKSSDLLFKGDLEKLRVKEEPGASAEFDPKSSKLEDVLKIEENFNLKLEESDINLKSEDIPCDTEVKIKIEPQDCQIKDIPDSDETPPVCDKDHASFDKAVEVDISVPEAESGNLVTKLGSLSSEEIPLSLEEDQETTSVHSNKLSEDAAVPRNAEVLNDCAGGSASTKENECIMKVCVSSESGDVSEAENRTANCDPEVFSQGDTEVGETVGEVKIISSTSKECEKPLPKEDGLEGRSIESKDVAETTSCSGHVTESVKLDQNEDEKETETLDKRDEKADDKKCDESTTELLVPPVLNLIENDLVDTEEPSKSQSPPTCARNSPTPDHESPIADSPEDSDSSSSIGIGDNCADDEVESDENIENDGVISKEIESNTDPEVSDVNRILNLELADSNLSVSPSFCDSTAMDAFSADDTDSQEYNLNTVAKGYSSALSSRKRTLSHTDDDTCDSFRSTKKVNGLLESHKSRDASNLISDSHYDNGLKRSAEVTTDSESKKLRVSEEPLSKRLADLKAAKKSYSSDKFTKNTYEKVETTLKTSRPIDFPFIRKLHSKEISTLSRSDLEELLLQKMCEAITERSITGELRARCVALEKRQEKEHEKFNKLRKQMTELSLVMKKYMDMQNRNKPSPPIKVTRSVGLQVFPCSAVRAFCPERHGIQIPQPGTVTPTRLDPAPAPDSVLKKTPVLSNKSPNFNPLPMQVVSSSDPPALVPTCTQSSILVPAPSRPAATPPRVPVPPLQQISGTRLRFSTPPSGLPASPQIVPIQQPKHQSTPNRPSTPQNVNRPPSTANDVEVIDITEKEDQNKRPAGAQVQQHQQKHAANAAAQSLAGNSGMTVRLISPTQGGQSTFPHLLVPSQGILRGMKIVFPVASSNGVTMSSGVVHMATSSGVPQIFTNANTNNRTSTVATARATQSLQVHPAPLPTGPPHQASNPAWKQIPPRPNLKIQHQNNGIVLSWNMALGPVYADIDSYQLYAYQEGSAPPSAGLWKKVGDVKALPLPMACTLTQFVEGHRYHFTVRAVDKHGRVGPFSQQGSIRLGS